MNRAENSALLRLLLAVENDIAETLNSDIMNVFKTKEAVEVHLVGKINRNIYRCITEDIVTDMSLLQRIKCNIYWIGTLRPIKK